MSRPQLHGTQSTAPGQLASQPVCAPVSGGTPSARHSRRLPTCRATLRSSRDAVWEAPGSSMVNGIPVCASRSPSVCVSTPHPAWCGSPGECRPERPVHPCCPRCFVCVCVLKSELQREREGDFPPLVHSADGRNSWGHLGRLPLLSPVRQQGPEGQGLSLPHHNAARDDPGPDVGAAAEQAMAPL